MCSSTPNSTPCKFPFRSLIRYLSDISVKLHFPILLRRQPLRRTNVPPRNRQRPRLHFRNCKSHDSPRLHARAHLVPIYRLHVRPHQVARRLDRRPTHPSHRWPRNSYRRRENLHPFLRLLCDNPRHLPHSRTEYYVVVG